MMNLTRFLRKCYRQRRGATNATTFARALRHEYLERRQMLSITVAGSVMYLAEHPVAGTPAIRPARGVEVHLMGSLTLFSPIDQKVYTGNDGSYSFTIGANQYGNGLYNPKVSIYMRAALPSGGTEPAYSVYEGALGRISGANGIYTFSKDLTAEDGTALLSNGTTTTYDAMPDASDSHVFEVFDALCPGSA